MSVGAKDKEQIVSRKELIETMAFDWRQSQRLQRLGGRESRLPPGGLEKVAIEPIGHVEANVVSLAGKKLVQRGLVDPGVFGYSIDAQAAGGRCVADVLGKGWCGQRVAAL